jgi:acyl-CoA thioester hydrolase
MPEGFRFSWPIRVRYSEVDSQGIVYNSRYLEYVDAALAEYFRALGLPYQEMVERHGFDPSLVQATLEFKRVARFDEVLRIHARVVTIGRSSFRMEFHIVREASPELVARVQIAYVNFDKHTQSSRPVPESIRRLIEQVEGPLPPAAPSPEAG